MKKPINKNIKGLMQTQHYHHTDKELERQMKEYKNFSIYKFIRASLAALLMGIFNLGGLFFAVITILSLFTNRLLPQHTYEFLSNYIYIQDDTYFQGISGWLMIISFSVSAILIGIFLEKLFRKLEWVPYAFTVWVDRGNIFSISASDIKYWMNSRSK